MATEPKVLFVLDLLLPKIGSGLSLKSRSKDQFRNSILLFSRAQKPTMQFLTSIVAEKSTIAEWSKVQLLFGGKINEN